MVQATSRREFLRQLGLSAAAFPFICNLPSLGFDSSVGRKKRLVIMFTPNGVVRKNFWPDEAGELSAFKEILSPLDPYKDRTLVLNGVCDKIRGDGDNHMRGMGCLLTGIELFPGNIQGGGATPAGWASGISIDQEIKNYLQSQPQTQTRFGSLEFGVVVPERADTWSRMVYSGPNKPIAPIDNPYQMFQKLYGNVKDQESLKSVLDVVSKDLKRVESLVSANDRRLLEEHASFVREMEKELEAANRAPTTHVIPQLEPGVVVANDTLPQLAKMQIDLMVNSFTADFARVATLQFTQSVGQARMKWLEIDETHHTLSHEPNSNEDAQTKLTKICKWYAEQLAYLVKKLSETPEPGGQGTLLDNTTIVWTNELGEGNSHTLDNIPFVMVGNGFDFKMGRSLQYKDCPHNRLLMSLAHGMGHHVERFGNPDYCTAGPLTDLT
ncbi:DUF1552 domain-containing protein [Planctomicrobium piriforme]|uniref:Tat (Twin-arginine translocation) pathway signal sequence n=1 Tax=Planctomicrobium piriforme TaxID=1576369 RepID=A0A1I3GXX2_9PLAN|nr:DUF1552 domain-containing protein [Planctomicrobium piriforme]SFI28303.1 Protein of unknown function [Planctomicrobium piriforme]